jgi:ubiquinone/menaquinone biosynthesis C-methylase UbiE
MNLAFLLSQQLRHPRGWLGARLGPLMNRENEGINSLALEHLKIESGQHVMEIGFGGGALLQRFLASAGSGIVTGVEMSQTLLNQARSSPHLRPAMLCEGTIESLPFADAAFDRICTVNTIYFWKNPSQGVLEVLRVLKPGGRFTIGFHTEADLRRTGVSGRVFRFHDAEEVESLLADHGFVSISRLAGRTAVREFVCVSGHRNSSIP